MTERLILRFQNLTESKAILYDLINAAGIFFGFRLCFCVILITSKLPLLTYQARQKEVKMQVRHLEYFAEIIRNGSINSAAKNLYISPQALSSIVTNLESEIGCSLLVRNRHGVTATEAGKTVYKDLQTILPIIGEWNNLGNKETKTTLDLYVSLAMAASMNSFLIKMEERHPDLSIITHELRGKTICDRTVKKNHMMAVVTLTDSIYDMLRKGFEKINLELLKLSDDEFCVVTGKEYFPGLNEITPEDARKMKLIYSADADDIIGRRFINEFGYQHVSKIESHSSILCMAALNQGAIILPKKAVEAEPLYKSGMLRALKFSEEKMMTRHYLLAPADELLSQEEKTLKEEIIGYYREWQ